MTTTPAQQYIEVVEISSGETIHRIDVTGNSPRNIEKAAMGLLLKVDTEKYFVREPS